MRKGSSLLIGSSPVSRFMWMGLLLAFLCTTLSTNAEVKSPISISVKPVASLQSDGNQGLSGMFAGSANNSLLLAGGCNFPNVPAAKGGAKVYSDRIFLLDHPEDKHAAWQMVGRLSQALAYGVSITTDEGIVCIGGTDGVRSSNHVFLLTLKNGKVSQSALPSLPVALDNMAGAAGDGYVYVVGGQTNGIPSNKVFRMKLSGGNRAWEALPDYPGQPRVQPVAAVQKDGEGTCFYLLGGFLPGTATHPGKVFTDVLCYTLHNGQWKRMASPVRPVGSSENCAFIGTSALSSGVAHILFFGGVNKDVFAQANNRPYLLAQARKLGNVALVSRLERDSAAFLSHPESWYRFQTNVLAYHTITDSWASEVSQSVLARAGAAVIPLNGTYYLVGGESKPGIRSADATAINVAHQTDFGFLNWGVLVVYLVGMLLIGWYFMRKEGGSDDFFRGGGRIPWWAAGISIYATMLSAITYMAIPAKAYATDWTYYPMLITLFLVSFPVIKYYLPFFRRLNVTSAYEYLERRFNYATRLMASVLFIVFMVARMALVLYLPSLALTTVTGIDIYLCITLLGVITIVYCTMGGVEAVVWSDVIQGIILVGGAIFAAVYLVFATDGGPSTFWQMGMANNKFRLIDWSFDWTKATFWVVIIGGFANNLISYTSDQTVIQRYLTTKDEKSAGRGILMNGLMCVFISVCFYVIGTGLYTFFKTHPGQLDFTLNNSDAIFPFFMMSQMPAGLAGLLIAAIFAATMSTISSNINSVSTSFSVDIYRHFNTKVSDKEMLKIARRTCVVSGVIGLGLALLMATWDILSLLDYFNTILGLLSGGLGGLFVMGIFFDRINARSALIGFLTGTVVVFLLYYMSDVSFFLYGAAGIVVSVVVALLCSYITPQREKQPGLTWKELDK